MHQDLRRWPSGSPLNDSRSGRFTKKILWRKVPFAYTRRASQGSGPDQGARNKLPSHATINPLPYMRRPSFTDLPPEFILNL